MVALVAAAVLGYRFLWTAGAASSYRTARIDRGTIASVVSASGTLAAVTTVQVGSQVSGQIKELFVDFNSPVEAGQLVARLAPEIFQAKVDAAEADLRNAQAAAMTQQANVEKARADVERARAGVATAAAGVERQRADIENVRAMIASAQATVMRDAASAANALRELQRRVDLLGKQLIAQSEKDQAQTGFDTAAAQLEAARSQERAAEAALRSAEAQLDAVGSQRQAAEAELASAQAGRGVAEAQLDAARAAVEGKRAVLRQARVDLTHTDIRAPVNGLVISRAVDVGQTVAASLQAPTLFVIAQDLTRMQAEAAVDEADVGRLRESMAATFTVDAFPGRTFAGRVSQIRKAPQIVQNVVTYTVVVSVANPDRRLLPGMTANVRIEVERKRDVVRLPNAALRVRLSGQTEAPTPAAPVRRGPAGAPADTAAGDPAGLPGHVYVLDSFGRPQTVPVVIGVSDESYSELLAGDLVPGHEVVISHTTRATAPTGGARLRF